MLRAIFFTALLAASPVLAQLAPPKPAASPATPAAAASAFKEARWEELVPKGWDPFARFKGMNLGMLSDSSPRVLQLMRELREALDNAPTVAEMDGSAVKLPGYVVPLEEVKGELKEFLLVPYFGACIHTPPPPANQIIHVLLAKPIKGFRAMDAVWVSGTLKAFRGDTAMGTSGYRMDAVGVDRYVPSGRR